MPGRTVLQSTLAALFRRWPGAERLALRALDLPYRVALLPFRRAAVNGRADEASGLAARTDAYNAAAERYFATFPNPDYLLNKPFSDTHGAARNLIDAGILFEALRVRPGDVVVELGAGSCWLSHMLNRFGCTTIAIDVSPTALALGRRLFARDPATNWALDPAFLVYDGHRLPLADAACDAIVIHDAFHHVPNQRELMREMYRVLRPHGMVAMSEPGYGHAAAETSVSESSAGVLENELVLEDLAALARACGFDGVNVLIAGAAARHEIPATDLGAFMGGRGFATYWKSLCSSLEQHHYVLMYKGTPEPTTRRPGRALARIEPATKHIRTAAGASLVLPVIVTNIGDTRWLSAAGPGWTRLGAHLYHANSTRDVIDLDWHRMELPRDLAPGEQLRLTLTLPPMPGPGDYLLGLDLVVEGMMWFADAGSTPASISISVGPG